MLAGTERLGTSFPIALIRSHQVRDSPAFSPFAGSGFAAWSLRLTPASLDSPNLNGDLGSLQGARHAIRAIDADRHGADDKRGRWRAHRLDHPRSRDARLRSPSPLASRVGTRSHRGGPRVPRPLGKLPPLSRSRQRSSTVFGETSATFPPSCPTSSR